MPVKNSKLKEICGKQKTLEFGVQAFWGLVGFYKYIMRGVRVVTELFFPLLFFACRWSKDWRFPAKLVNPSKK